MTMHEKQSITTDSVRAKEGIGGQFYIRRVCGFCTELGYPQKPSKIYMDNEEFIKTILCQRGCSKKSKYILIRQRVLEQALKNKKFELLHLATFNMVA